MIYAAINGQLRLPSKQASNFAQKCVKVLVAEKGFIAEAVEAVNSVPLLLSFLFYSRRSEKDLSLKFESMSLIIRKAHSISELICLEFKGENTFNSV